MGCSSSSTQTLAQENRPGVKAEEANGETLITHNGIVAEDSETISDQMQLPVQGSLLDEMGPGPETAEEIQAEASEAEQPTSSSDSDVPLSPEAPAEELPVGDAAALEPTDTEAVGTGLTAEPASDLTAAESTPEPESAVKTAPPEVPKLSSEPTLDEVEVTAIQELPPSSESTPVLEPVPVEPVLNEESTEPPSPEPAQVEPNPVLELTVSETVRSSETALTAPPEATPVETCPVLEPTPVEPSAALDPTPDELSPALEPTPVEPSPALESTPEEPIPVPEPTPDEPSPALEPTPDEPSPALEAIPVEPSLPSVMEAAVICADTEGAAAEDSVAGGEEEVAVAVAAAVAAAAHAVDGTDLLKPTD